MLLGGNPTKTTFTLNGTAARTEGGLPGDGNAGKFKLLESVADEDR